MRICPFPWCLLTALVQVLVRTCLHDAGALHRSPCSQVHPPLGMIHMVTKLILKHYSHQVISLPKAPCWLPRVSSFFHYLVFVSISGFSLTLAIPYTSTSPFFWSTYSSLSIRPGKAFLVYLRCPSLWPTPWGRITSYTAAPYQSSLRWLASMAVFNYPRICSGQS